MPVTAGPELIKVTLNLYAADVDRLKATFGYGWTTEVRQIVHDHVVKHRQRQTAGDFDV